MGIELGRISGPLLARDLVRKNSGVGEENLAFETDLLYLDVVNGRVGINTDVPSSPRKLDINGTFASTNLLVPTQFSTPNLVISTNKIQNLVDKIYIQPNQATDPKIVMTKIGTANLRISDQLIENITTDSDITFDTTGTGTTVITSSELYVDGDLHATGDITWDGNITFGNNDSDNVEFSADINSHIIPNINQTYDLGTASKRWNKIYTKDLTADTLTYDTITINDINLLLTQGNTYYVSVNGNDTYVGDHLHNTFRTIKHALSQATAGDTVVIFPGTYEEIFPLTVPTGVTVNGAGIRAVTIVPTPTTDDKDCFLLNGETTVSHLTVRNFYYNSTNNTGYAFRLAANSTVTSRSPYVQNCTVITEERSLAGTPANIYVDPEGLGLSYSSSSVTVTQAMHSESLVQSWVGKTLVTYFGDGNTPSFYTVTGYIDEPQDPGVLWRIELGETFNVAEQAWLFSIYPNDGETVIVGSASYVAAYDYARSFPKSSLPPFFNTTVGEYWTCQIGEGLNIIDSIEEDPTNNTWWKINFKSLATITFGPPIFTSPSLGGIQLGGHGALVDGSSVLSTSNEASMLFHSVTMIVPNSIGVHATNGARVEWLDGFTYFADKGLYLTQGTAGFAGQGLRFGAELRSIGSANIYGTYGAVADGADTIGYIINHNFAYIGSGTNYNNDPSLVIQANEVVEQNNGKIYYESTDQKGDFRIGDIFYVNQETGEVIFNAQSISFTPTGNITLTGPTSSAFIDATTVSVGNIRIYDNVIDSIAGSVNFLAFSGITNLNTDVFVTGNTNISADVVVKGNLYLGNQATDTITVFPNLTQSLLPDDVGGPFTLGTDPKRWNTLYATLLDVDGVTQITTNTISTLTTDTSLILSAAGTGKVQVTNTDVEIANDLTVGGTLTVNGVTNLKDITLAGNVLQTGSWGQTGDTYITGLFANNNIEITGTSYFEVSNIKLYNNEISATATDDNLNFVGLGTGSVILDQRLSINGSSISNIWTSPTTDTQKSIIFQPDGTGNVTVDSNKSLTIPVGNNSTRTISVGEIRYNNLTNLFEGGKTTGVISLNGLYDNDRNTYIRAGATDNTFYFGINNTELVDLNSTRLYTSLYHVDNISLTGNTINNRISGNDLIFSPNGTGNTVLNNVAFGAGGDTITNLTGGALVIESTGIGFVRFTGNAGLVLPNGTSLQRRASPEIGEVRYNTTENVTEVYSGDPLLGDNGWIPAIGTSGEISAEDVLDLLEIYTLVLG